MAQDFTPPPGPAPVQEYPVQPPTPPKKNNTIWIVLAVVVVLLCCCCLVAAGVYLYNNGDRIFNLPTSLAPFLNLIV
jgi:hypothetical protein